MTEHHIKQILIPDNRHMKAQSYDATKNVGIIIKNGYYSKMRVGICGDKLKIMKSGANKRSRKDGIKCVKS